MGFLADLLDRSSKPRVADAGCQVSFDEDGRVSKVEARQGRWALSQKGPNRYYTQKADSLLQASEILKSLGSIPGLTYYAVDTPDGTLARDVNGYYTEAPVRRKDLVLASKVGTSAKVEFSSLTGFGDMLANQTSVAQLKGAGEYARLVLLMKCGHCGYESPVETEPGDMTRQCYCCGAENSGHRANVSVVLNTGIVAI